MSARNFSASTRDMAHEARVAYAMRAEGASDWQIAKALGLHRRQLDSLFIARLPNGDLAQIEKGRSEPTILHPDCPPADGGDAGFRQLLSDDAITALYGGEGYA